MRWGFTVLTSIGMYANEFRYEIHLQNRRFRPLQPSQNTSHFKRAERGKDSKDN